MEIKLLQHYQFNLSKETLIDNFNYSKLEQIRANNYVQMKLKTEYLLQRQLIRGALFKEYQRRNISNTSFLSQPSDIVIDYNSKGKPFLKDRAFHFSVSHSRKLLIIVCSHLPGLLRLLRLLCKIYAMRVWFAFLSIRDSILMIDSESIN